MTTDPTNLEKWCEGKPVFVATAATNLIPALRGIHETFHAARAGTDEEFPPIPLPVWRRMFKRQSEITRMVWGLLTEVQNPQSIRDRFKNVSVDDAESWISEKFSDETVLESFVETVESKAAADDEGAAEFAVRFARIAAFIQKVWLPCWFLYSTLPVTLLRRARHGDLAALEDLLRVDKSIVTDPLVAEQWHAIMTGENQTLRKQMLDAMAGKPRKSLTLKRLKLWAGAAILLVADAVAYRMNRVELRELFDAAARDDGHPFDHDLPEGDEALYQGVQRERKDVLEMLGITYRQWQAIIAEAPQGLRTLRP